MSELEKRKNLKIGIVGSHGVGKTTFALDLAQLMQKTGKFSVSVLTEIVRECPYPLGVNQSAEATNWVTTRQISRELELIRNASVLICDRTSLDAYVYTLASENHESEGVLKGAAIEWLETYDLLVWVRPDADIVDDGFRMLDHGFRQKVDDYFAQFLQNRTGIEVVWQSQVMSPDALHDVLLAFLEKVDRHILDAAHVDAEICC